MNAVLIATYRLDQKKAKILKICPNGYNAAKKVMKYSRKFKLTQNSLKTEGLPLRHGFCRHCQILFVLYTQVIVFLVILLFSILSYSKIFPPFYHKDQ